MNLLEYDQNIYKCVICMDRFTNPAIGSDGIVYCEECITEWNKKNESSPQIQTNGDVVKTKVTGPIKSSIVENMCLISNILTDLNLLKLVHNKNIVCIDLDDAIQIIDMIDLENHYRIKENREQDIILKMIFSNQTLIKNILNFIHTSDRSWKGVDGWTIPHYVIRFGECELIEFMINSFNFNLEIPNEEKNYPVHFAFGQGNFLSSTHQLKIIDLFLKQNIDLDVLDEDGWPPLHFICSSINYLDSHDQLEALRIIINKNVKLETPIDEGFYPIHQICSGHNYLESDDKVKAIKMMIDKNINLEICTGEDSCYPIHYISSDDRLKFEDKEEIFKIMIEKKVNFKVKTKDEKYPVDMIIESNLTADEKSKLIKMFWLS